MWAGSRNSPTQLGTSSSSLESQNRFKLAFLFGAAASGPPLCALLAAAPAAVAALGCAELAVAVACVCLSIL